MGTQLAPWTIGWSYKQSILMEAVGLQISFWSPSLTSTWCFWVHCTYRKEVRYQFRPKVHFLGHASEPTILSELFWRRLRSPHQENRWAISSGAHVKTYSCPKNPRISFGTEHLHRGQAAVASVILSHTFLFARIERRINITLPEEELEF